MRTCLDCGEPLPENCGKNRLRCDACSRTREKELCYIRHRDRNRKKKAQQKAQEKTSVSLSEIARKAKEAGVSYGEYVATKGETK